VVIVWGILGSLKEKVVKPEWQNRARDYALGGTEGEKLEKKEK